MIKQERQQKTESEFSFRPGQRKAHNTIVDFLKSPKESSYILATGSFGKTVLYVKGVEEYRALNPDKSGVLVLADSVNLLNQLEREFKVFAPNLTTARASRENPYPKADVTFASIQRCRTLLNEQKLDELLRPLVIVDEAHSLLGEETQKLVAYMIKQGCRVLGGTATDEYYADKKLSTVLGPPCYTLTYQEALELKVVAPFKTGAISLPFNMSQVHKIGADYDQAALAAVFPAEMCAKAIATYHKLYHPGNKGYVQCLSRAHAKSTAAYLTKAGIPSAAVTGDLQETEREDIIQQAKKGKLHLLCGRNLLVQGIDWPEASVAYNFPSASKLAVEQRGFRVTRLDPANPNKCANIVEILPTTIAKTRPPLMFREVVDGGIHLKGGRTSRPEKSLRSKASPTEFELFPDERDAVAIINEVLQGSGPWARLSRNIPTPEKLNEMTAALVDSTSAFLNNLSEHDQFPNLLEALALNAMRELRESDSVPKLDPKVERAIDELTIIGNFSDEPRAEALREIQRFLFGPAKYRSETDTVCALGLSPARVSELLPECLQLNEADLLAGLLTIGESLSLLNLMGESASALAAVFEPLIECQATLRRLNRTGPPADSDWYFRGAKTLMESILLHDGSTTKRFQSYLNYKIGEEFLKVQRENIRSKESGEELPLLFLDPSRLDSLSSGRAQSGQQSILQGHNPEEWRESLLEHLTMSALSSEKEATRSRRLRLAAMYTEALVEGKSLHLKKDVQESFNVSTSALRQDIVHIRNSAQDWFLRYEPSLQVLFRSFHHSEELRPSLPGSLGRLDQTDICKLYEWLRCGAYPFGQRGEKIRSLRGMSINLGQDLTQFVDSSMLHHSYKETLKALIEHMVQPSNKERDSEALFKTEQFRSHGWRTAREATECLAVLLLVAGNTSNVDLATLSDKLPFKVTYEHLFAAGLEPHPGDVLVGFLRNELKFHLHEYLKPSTWSEATFSHLLNAALDTIPGGSAWIIGDSANSYFLNGSKRGLFGKSIAELRVEPPTGQLLLGWNPLFFSYLSLALLAHVQPQSLTISDPVTRSRVSTKLHGFVNSSRDTRTLVDFLKGWQRVPLEQLKEISKDNRDLIRIIEQHEAAAPLHGALKVGRGKILDGHFGKGGSQQPENQLLDTIYELARVAPFAFS